MRVLYSAWLKDLKSADELLDGIGKAGFAGVEISVDYPLCHGEEIPHKFLSRLKTSGYVYSFHLPWRDLALASPLEDIRRSSLKEVKQCIKVLQEFTPEYFVAHLSTNQAFCGYRDRKCVQAGINSLKELLPLIEDIDIPLEIETTTDRCCGDEEHLPYILSSVRSNSLGVCLDPPHIIERRLKKWGEFYELNQVLRDQAPELIERIQIIHVHGYNSRDGVLRSHLIPDEGLVKTLMNELKDMNVLNHVEGLVIEAFNKVSLREDIPQLRHVVEVIKDFWE